MTSQMVYVPLTRAQATRLRVGAEQDAGRARDEAEVVGHAATAALIRAHDDDRSLEEAEFVALGCAGVRALLDPSGGVELRLVLAAEVPGSTLEADPEDPYGQVQVRALTWSSVRALFSDEPSAAAAVARARTAAAGHTLVEALALPAVQALTDEFDLLWFAPEELDQLPG